MMGNSVDGSTIDSNIVWESRKIFGFDGHFMIYNHFYWGYAYLVPFEIKNDTLVVWDFLKDGYFFYYTKF